MRASSAVLLAIAVGCSTSPRVGRASERYDACDDPIGSAAVERAEALRDAGDDAARLDALRTAIERCPDYVPAHVAYQDLALELGGDDEAAMRALYAAMPDRPESPVPPYLLARLADEDFPRQELLDLSLTRDAAFYPAHVERARMLRRLGRTAEALESLQRAIEAREECPQASLEIAGVLRGLGRGQEAAPHYARYLELQPDDSETRREYLELLVYSLGRLDEAQRVADVLLQRDPRDPVVLMDVAAIEWQRGELDEAVATYHDVLEVDPTRDRAVLNLGNLYYGPLVDAQPDRKAELWAKARAAYRYFLGMRRAEGLFDVLDYHVGVPYRLEQIARELGPAPDLEPTLAEF